MVSIPYVVKKIYVIKKSDITLFTSRFYTYLKLFDLVCDK